jgi:hypothetical protein
MENTDELIKPMTNEFVDKVTLELLMNKNHYNRYLSQTDPKKHQEHLNHLEKIRKYRSKIINVTTDFLNNPEHQITTEINEAFDHYVRTLIRHYECKEMENPEETNQEEDMLFGNMAETIEDEEQPTMKSYWGKHKVQKKSSSYGFPMNFVPRIKSENLEEL